MAVAYSLINQRKKEKKMYKYLATVKNIETEKEEIISCYGTYETEAKWDAMIQARGKRGGLFKVEKIELVGRVLGNGYVVK